MKQLLEVKEYRKLRYAGQSPDVRTLKRWIDNGVLPGTKEGNMYFVYVDEVETDKVNQLVSKVMG